MIISLEKGQMLELPVTWIFFVLTNTDIMCKLNKAPLKLKLGNNKQSFEGTIFGTQVDLEILGDTQIQNEGKIDIVANVKLPFGMGRTHTVAHCKYTVVNTNTGKDNTMLNLWFKLETTGFLMSIYAFSLRRKVNRYIEKVLRHNERAASLLMTNAVVLKRRLSEEQLGRVKTFRESSAKQITSTSPDNSLSESKKWGRELQDLVELHSEYQGQIDALKEELDRLVDAQDAVLTLASARRTLETIMGHLCQIVLNRSLGKDKLPHIIDKLGRSGVVPEDICNSMKNLTRLGNKGAHASQKISPRQVREALAALCSIMEWYITVDEEALALKNSPSMQYKILCQQFYANSIPSIKQRQKLETKRKGLGLSPMEAKKIERSAISPEIRELQMAIETIFFDGKMNEEEELFFSEKAKELEVSPELATMILDDCRATMEDNLEAKYRSLCNGFYNNSIPTKKQRQKMETERENLGLAVEEAKEIEEACIPQQIRELRIAIGTIYYDGKITESDKKHLNEMVMKLKMDPKVATEIIEEYCTQMDDSLELRYRSLCESIYLGSIPTVEQRKELDAEREKFGLSKEEAEDIEEDFISDEIQEYQSSLEGVYSDGKVRRREREFLDKKAEELGLDSELVIRLESQIEDTPQLRYRIACNELYVNGFPSVKEKKALYDKRKKLGLSEEEALEIEDACIPDEIQEYQSALEGIYSDGKVRRRERKFLDKKAKQLGISPDIAAILESQIEDSPQVKYRIMCNELYKDRVPALEEISNLKKKAIELELTEKETLEIEDGCIPDEIQEFKSALEGVYADGKVRESERAFLTKKAKQLGFSPEMADEIENQHISSMSC